MEKDAEGCYNLIFKLHDLSRKLDPEHLALFYSKALTLCLECEPMILSCSYSLSSVQHPTKTICPVAQRSTN